LIAKNAGNNATKQTTKMHLKVVCSPPKGKADRWDRLSMMGAILAVDALVTPPMT